MAMPLKIKKKAAKRSEEDYLNPDTSPSQRYLMRPSNTKATFFLPF